MADMTDTLKSLLGDNADEKINGIMQILNNGNADNSAQGGDEGQKTDDSPPQITPEMISMAQSVMSRLSDSGDDDRTKLLMSLKPYMRNSRRQSIDTAVKMLNLANLSQFFKGVI